VYTRGHICHAKPRTACFGCYSTNIGGYTISNMPLVRVQFVGGVTKTIEYIRDATDLYEAVEKAFCVRSVRLTDGGAVLPRNYDDVPPKVALFHASALPVPVYAGMTRNTVLDALSAFLPPAHPYVTQTVTTASGASLTRGIGTVDDFPLTVTLTIAAAPVGAAGGSRKKRTPRRRSCRKKSPYGRRF
jgi:hypothetical protein